MPRGARKQAESGVYHLMMRGINRQLIFEDENDSERFLEVLSSYKETCGYELLGYCLMGNHVHILMRVGAEPLQTVMRRIAAKYVYWYNVKYERVGHLFQERFRSEPVEDDAYLMTVLRYIHRNPVKAGLCEKPEDYRLSSYRDYLGRAGIVDTGFVLSMVSPAELAAFTSQDVDDACLDMPEMPSRRLTDEGAAAAIERISGCGSSAAFQALPVEERDRFLPLILEAGVSVRQASRLTGVSVGVVRRFTPGVMSRNT